jgi:hypothetical protein
VRSLHFSEKKNKIKRAKPSPKYETKDETFILKKIGMFSHTCSPENLACGKCRGPQGLAQHEHDPA